MIRFFPRRLTEYVRSWFRPPARGPVKRFFSAGLLALLGFGLLASVSSQPDDARLVLRTETNTVAVGERFMVDVMVDASTAVNAVDVSLSYPEAKLDIEALRDGRSVLTIWTEPPSVNGDEILIRGGTFRRGFSGEHRILSIAARATAPGVIRIDPRQVTLLAGDGTGDDVRVDERSMDSLRLYAVATERTSADAETVAATDLSGSGGVTMQDISMFMAAWHDGAPTYDFTGDGRMTFRDFSILLAHFFLER